MVSLIYRVLADVVLVVHFAFVAYVAMGGLLVVRWPRTAWAHVPVALWGAWIDLAGWVCPLTPLENRLRTMGGETGYGGGFIEHYIVPVLYPAGMERSHQLALGAAVLLWNGALYGLAWHRSRRGTGEP